MVILNLPLCCYSFSQGTLIDYGEVAMRGLKCTIWGSLPYLVAFLSFGELDQPHLFPLLFCLHPLSVSQAGGPTTSSRTSHSRNCFEVSATVNTQPATI